MQSDLDWLIIYEDDLWLGGLETIEFIDNVMREYLPPDGNFLALNALEGEFYLHRAELNVNQYISERFQAFCLGLSAISKKAAAYMLEKMQSGIDNPIDLFIFNKEFEQKTYSLIPNQQVAAQISL